MHYCSINLLQKLMLKMKSISQLFHSIHILTFEPYFNPDELAHLLTVNKTFHDFFMNYTIFQIRRAINNGKAHHASLSLYHQDLIRFNSYLLNGVDLLTSLQRATEEYPSLPQEEKAEINAKLSFLVKHCRFDINSPVASL